MARAASISDCKQHSVSAFRDTSLMGRSYPLNFVQYAITRKFRPSVELNSTSQKSMARDKFAAPPLVLGGFKP
jgi:hypothetical protein